MAEINLGSDSKMDNRAISSEILSSSVESQNIREQNGLESEIYSMEELKDPAKIRVTIADTSTPLVVLFGPPSCGKTMTLIRLTRYLRGINGYAIEPVTSFRPAHDKNYEEMCSGFNAMINNNKAAGGTNKINFMLIKIYYKGKAVCQILEAPGEHYFDPDPKEKEPDKEFLPYVNAVINSKNRKIWAIIVEPDKTNKRMNPQRENYVTKIANKLKTHITSRDKILFVFNKIDETPFVLSPGKVYIREAMKVTNEQLYPNIFIPFLNMNPITRFWKPYNFDFIPFQTGSYSKAADGTLMYQEGHDVYPVNLWNRIMKLVRG